MEIERKFTIKQLPTDLESYPSRHIEQGYLSESPVIRVRKEDDEYFLTYKGKGMMARKETNLAIITCAQRLTARSYPSGVI